MIFLTLVSEGFCLTRNFLLGIPISAALTQYKNKKHTNNVFRKGEKHMITNVIQDDRNKSFQSWYTTGRPVIVIITRDKFQERRVLIG